MNHSPLQLERHFFTRINIEALPERVRGDDFHLAGELDLKRRIDDERRFQLTLTVNLGPEGDSKPGYTGELQIIGLFRVEESFPLGKSAELVETNGATLLFGAVREMVCNLTARGPWPLLRMDCVSFRRLVPEKAKEVEGAAPKKLKTTPPKPTTRKSGKVTAKRK